MCKGLETDIAPDFSLTDTEDKKVSLSDYKGKKIASYLQAKRYIPSN